jgi:biopolymer transport protein ExbB
MKTRSSLKRSLLLTATLLTLGVAAGAVMAQSDNAAPAATDQPGKFAVVTKLLFDQPDFVTVIIAILSVVSVTFIIRSFMQVRESVLMPQKTIDDIRGMIEGRKFQQLIEFTQNDPSFVSRALYPALQRAPKFADMKDAMETAVGEQTADQFRKIEILNIIGNLGPLLGLLGTVLGMIVSFDAMQRQGGNANPQVLAAGIATALAHTFLGLFLAIPNLACFGILRTRADALTTRAAVVSEELLQMIKPQDNTKPASTPSSAARAQPVAG